MSKKRDAGSAQLAGRVCKAKGDALSYAEAAASSGKDGMTSEIALASCGRGSQARPVRNLVDAQICQHFPHNLVRRSDTLADMQRVAAKKVREL